MSIRTRFQHHAPLTHDELAQRHHLAEEARRLREERSSVLSMVGPFLR
jgi:hypothetical protein